MLAASETGPMLKIATDQFQFNCWSSIPELSRALGGVLGEEVPMSFSLLGV